ncbi:MAG: FtsW/RodA/SpoVE family cell cycle protein [Lachnospiraceae bacterium]|nr:FtsW/RodA/SpoVE family cell cycle protein [Lachnospiraceae bacterium]
MLRQYKLRDYRFSLVIWVMALSSLGIMIIGSAEETLQYRQLGGLCIGLVLMLVISVIDYSWLLNFYWIFYLAGNGLLLAVLLVGENVNGATRWIRIGIQFQPSDLVKIILILFFAKFFSKYEDKLNTLKIILFSLILLGIPLFLIYKEPDLSTTLVTALTFCAIIFIAGLSYKIIGGILVVAVPLAVILLSIILQLGQTLIEDYQLSRIMAWLKPAEYATEAYQQTNSIIAIGSGQLYGKGLNNNMVSSVKNGNFIVEPQTDFIFAVAGEELGFLGCCLIIILELLIAVECIRIGRRAKDLAGTLICCGLGALIMFQSFFNICVATGLMPNTGIPLPFVSYGMTSLISFCIGIGVVLNIGLQTRKY